MWPENGGFGSLSPSSLNKFIGIYKSRRAEVSLRSFGHTPHRRSLSPSGDIAHFVHCFGLVTRFQGLMHELKLPTQSDFFLQHPGANDLLMLKCR